MVAPERWRKPKNQIPIPNSPLNWAATSFVWRLFVTPVGKTSGFLHEKCEIVSWLDLHSGLSPILYADPWASYRTSLLRKCALNSGWDAEGEGPHLLCRARHNRHTYATMMLRASISLTALKEILGHRDIRMTMRYVQVTQTDLQRQYHLARQNMAYVHAVPQLQTTHDAQADNTGIAAICRVLDAVKHQLEMHRRQTLNQQTKNKIQPLARRLAKLRAALAALEST